MTGMLDGRRALVTGGASGIGRAIALAFAAAGAHVAIADRADAGAVVKAIAAAGGRAFVEPVDVADEAAVLGLFAAALPRLGGLDLLVNAAGILFEKPLLETDIAEFDRLMAINLRGTFLVGREALRVMTRQRGGRVINIASELAYLGCERMSAYCASKGAVVSLTRSWAREFAPNILVNAIAPGPTDTPMLTTAYMDAATVAGSSNVPLGRLGRPEEIAAAALFLADPANSYMTGQCISPNGGAVML
ncbi:MAG TPA: SDR family oxidoreductase [Methylomirabilota bacterium]|nr:SDR family oxidoreductase [Methylomirabilota bacterium]